MPASRTAGEGRLCAGREKALCTAVWIGPPRTAAPILTEPPGLDPPGPAIAYSGDEMTETNIVSFDDAMRARGTGTESGQGPITDELLRRTQPVIDIEQCHVALDRCRVVMKSKTSRFMLFDDLSAAFPKGRRIAILGHKGSGKTVLIDMMLKRRSVQSGRVLVNSRMSWAVSYLQFFDRKLTLRQNIVFLANILGVSPSYMMGAACEICNFQEKQLKEQFSHIPAAMRRRIGLLAYLLADFDCHILDGQLRSQMFGPQSERVQMMMDAVMSRDYISTLSKSRQLPENCDLVYILYDGRLFAFDDVAEGAAVFEALPEPENPNPFTSQDEKDEDGEDELASLEVM